MGIETHAPGPACEIHIAGWLDPGVRQARARHTTLGSHHLLHPHMGIEVHTPGPACAWHTAGLLHVVSSSHGTSYGLSLEASSDAEIRTKFAERCTRCILVLYE